MTSISREEFIQFEKRFETHAAQMTNAIDVMSQSVSKSIEQSSKSLNEMAKISASLQSVSNNLSVQLNDQSIEIRDIRSSIEAKSDLYNTEVTRLKSVVETLEQDKKDRKLDSRHGKWAFYGWLLTMAGYFVQKLIMT